MSAWKQGLKGITIFRSGCARAAILSAPSDKKNKEHADGSERKIRNDLDVIGLEHHLTTGCGSLHICAYFDKQGNLKNTYLSKGSSGGCNNFMIGLSRMISLAARNGVSIQEIVDQLNSCGTCPSYAVRRATKKDVSPGSCCPVAIGNALMEMWRKVNNQATEPVVKPTKPTPVTDSEQANKSKCPECGSELIHEMGCVTCTSCGYSKCG
jgi:ribonucleoside-diphosphate reductase alpha chain